MSPPAVGSLDPTARLRRLFGDSLVYGSASAANKLLALVTFPLLARQLSVTDYGTVDLFLVLANWLALVVVLGMDSALARLIIELDDEAARAQLVSQALLWVAAPAALVAIVLGLARADIAAALGTSDHASHILLLMALQLPFAAVTTVAQALLRWTFRRWAFVGISMGMGVTYAVALGVAFGWGDPAPVHVFMISLSVQGLFAIVSLVCIRHWLVWPRAVGHWRALLPMALPMGLVSCLAAATPLLERTLVHEGIGNEALGLYAAGAKLAALLSLPIAAFQSGWAPFALAIYGKHDAARTFNGALLIFVWLVCLCVLALSAIGPPLLTLLASPRYADGAVVIFPLAMALGVQGIGAMLEVGITVSKRMHLSLLAYLAMVAVFLVVGMVLMRPLGLFGVALGMLVAQLAFACASAALAQRAHALAWHLGRPGAMLVVTLAAGLLHHPVSVHWGWQGGAAVVVAAALALLVWGAILPELRTAAAQILRRGATSA